MCDTPEYVDRRQVQVQDCKRDTARMSHFYDTPEHVDIMLVLIHLYVESQSDCPMCVTHLNMWIEGKSWFICI